MENSSSLSLTVPVTYHKRMLGPSTKQNKVGHWPPGARQSYGRMLRKRIVQEDSDSSREQKKDFSKEETMN